MVKYLKFLLLISIFSFSSFAMADLPPNDFSSVGACDQSVQQDAGYIGYGSYSDFFMNSDSNGASPSFGRNGDTCIIAFGTYSDPNSGMGLCRMLGPQSDPMDLSKVYALYAPQVKVALQKEVDNYNSGKAFDGTPSFFRVICTYSCAQDLNPATDCSGGFVNHSR